VIDRAAYDRIRNYIELGKTEARLAYQGTVPAGDGYFIPPTVFVDMPPQARIAQEEIFGPVLCVLKARSLDEALALRMTLSTRSPAGSSPAVRATSACPRRDGSGQSIHQPRHHGALVARHPFGGFKMSGGGTKAGGRDYLVNFLLPRVVTENTMRRGFAPETL